MTVSASLEIHEINIGQGDSILIINRDLAATKKLITAAKGVVPADPIDYMPYCVANDIPLTGTVTKALLVDGGDDEYGGNVVDYMDLYGVLDGTTVWRPDLMVAVSHYHDDHMAGLRSVFKERINPKKKGDKVVFKERLRPGVVYQSLPNSKTNPKTERFALFQSDVDVASKATGKNKTKRVLLNPGGVDSGATPARISLGTGVDGIPITVSVVASGQSVNNGTGVTAIASTGKTVDQNDRSVVLMLQYGSFPHLLGGDNAGNGLGPGGNFGGNAVATGTKKFFSSAHADVETTLGLGLEVLFPATAKWLANQPKFVNPGYATVVKANHHGSSSSLDVHLLGTLQPLLLLISSGVKSRFHNHPTQQVMNRATKAQTATWGLHKTLKRLADSVKVPNSIAQIYVTEVGNTVKNVTFRANLYTAKIMGDIVVRPVDETISAIQAATAKGQKLTVQVYGTGDLSKMTDPGTTLRDTVTPNVPVSIYPLGPFTHSDTH